MKRKENRHWRSGNFGLERLAGATGLRRRDASSPASSATVTALTCNEFGQFLSNNPGASARLAGGGGADTMVGGAAAELLYGDFAGGTGPGLAGGDLISSADGNDTIYGEAGRRLTQNTALHHPSPIMLQHAPFSFWAWPRSC